VRWGLVKQSFVILRSDKQLMLFPILSAMSCLMVTALIATGGTLAMIPAMAWAASSGQPWQPHPSPLFLLGMFTLYVANYFVIVFFNVALVGVANSRLMGGNWTFREGIELAWARKGTILQWAFLAATVGMILRTLEERMGLIGRTIMRIIGIAWTLACYFVVPVLAFEDLSPIAAIKRSSKLFRDTWGEKVIGRPELQPGFFRADAAGLWPVVDGDCRSRDQRPAGRIRLADCLHPDALGGDVRGARHLQRRTLPLRVLQTSAGLV
jgi:Family of unknown function (DUF6159)